MRKVIFRFGAILVSTVLTASNAPVFRAGAADTKPTMPKSFDKATVTLLLEKVDQGQNASVLKIGYFLNHRHPSFPVAQGYQLMSKQLKAEKPYSRRWFVLQSLVGWAAIRLGPESSAEGLRAYNSLFSHTQEAKQINASAIVQHAIYEYVSTISTTHLSRDDVEVQQILQKSFLASLLVGEKDGFSPEWSMAVVPNSQAESAKFIRGIGQVLENQHSDVSLKGVKNAVTIYLALDPTRGLDLLKKTENSFLGTEKEWYDDAIIDALENQGQIEKAFALQKTRVEKSGKGYLRLVRLHIYLKNLNNSNWEDVDATLTRLAKSKEPAEETVEIARFLMRLGDSGNPLYPKDQLYPRAIRVLKSHLEVSPTDHKKNTLLAKYYAALMLFSLEKKAEGLQISVVDISTPFTSEERAIYESIQRLRSKYKGN